MRSTLNSYRWEQKFGQKLLAPHLKFPECEGHQRLCSQLLIRLGVDFTCRSRHQPQEAPPCTSSYYPLGRGFHLQIPTSTPGSTSLHIFLYDHMAQILRIPVERAILTWKGATTPDSFAAILVWGGQSLTEKTCWSVERNS